MDKEEVSEEPESSKVKIKIEKPKENIRKGSGRRLKMKAPKRSKRQKTDSDHEEENHLRTCLKIVPEEEEKIDYEVLGTRMDLVEIYSLVMKRFETTPPEGIDLLLWEDGTKINMLAERRYPLTKNTLERMMDIRLTAVSDDDTVFDLLRFIEQQIDEFGGQDEVDGLFSVLVSKPQTNGHQFSMFNKHKNWLVHKQTACGIDFVKSVYG
ncbi:hypothetical protein Tco_0267291 [Tanacetum coccineum]